MLRQKKMIHRRTRPILDSGFSLIEVVLALSIAVFAGFTLIALFAVGLQDGSDSRERFQAASIAEGLLLCAPGRADYRVSVVRCQQGSAQIVNGAIFSGNALPLKPLAPVNNRNFNNNVDAELVPPPVYLTWDGAVTTVSNAERMALPVSALIYNIDLHTPIPARSNEFWKCGSFTSAFTGRRQSNPAKLGSRSRSFRFDDQLHPAFVMMRVSTLRSEGGPRLYPGRIAGGDRGAFDHSLFSRQRDRVSSRKRGAPGMGTTDNYMKARTILSTIDRDIQMMVFRPDVAVFPGQRVLLRLLSLLFILMRKALLGAIIGRASLDSVWNGISPGTRSLLRL